MHLICVQDTLTLLEVIEEVFMLHGEAEGAAAEQTINIIIHSSSNNYCMYVATYTLHSMIIPAAFVVNSTVGVRVALNPLCNVTVMVTL